MSAIGVSIPRADATGKVTGEARFAADLEHPDALHMQVLFAGRPHARIESIQTERAKAAPGVKAVFTGQDVPNNRYGLMVADQPVLCTEVVRFVGDQVAVVVAETQDMATQALKLIHVRYAELPVIDSASQALQSEAPQVHPRYAGNIMDQIRLRRGDVSQGFAASQVIVENVYRTPPQEHAFLEPEAGLAYIEDDGSIAVIAAGQNPHDDQRQIAHALGIPPSRVRVSYGPVGGAFGGREDVSVQILLALAAWSLKRPVKIRWSRTQSILGHCKRHAMVIRHKWGADKDGHVLAAEVDITADAGPYAFTSPSVLECLHSLCVGPYDIPNVSMDGRMVCTNNIPGGAFRGFGGPQVAFAAEGQIDRLADRLGIDPVTIRLRNCLREGSLLPIQTPIPGPVSLPRLIRECARRMGYRENDGAWQRPEFPEAEAKRRGVAVSAAFRHAGFGHGFPEKSQARVTLFGGAQVERAEVLSAAADVGQGSHNVLRQIAAAELQIPVEQVVFTPGDTQESDDAGAASGSRLTYVAGSAVAQAAREALIEWQAENRPASATVTWCAPDTTAPDPMTGACFGNFTYSFAAQGVEVSVDKDTGEVCLRRVVAIHDPGKAINPEQVVGQIQGGIVQAHGWTTMENFVSRSGRVLSDQLSTYLIPTSLDIPTEVEAVLIEEPDPGGPFGARGVGEIPFVPLAPAVISAVHHATGIWIDELPLLPEVVLKNLRSREAVD